MKRFAPALLAAALLAASAGAPALAQDGNALSGGNGGPPPGNPDNLNLGADAPQSATGELVPLPGAPPSGAAADLKLPDCQPPACGVPDIMAPPAR